MLTRPILKPLSVALAMLALFIILRRPLLRVAVLAAGGGALTFLLLPLTRWLEKRMSRPFAALVSLTVVLATVTGLLWFFLPRVIREAGQLMETLPRSIEAVSLWSKAASGWLSNRLPGVRLPAFPMDRLTALLGTLASGTLAFAGSAAGAVSKLSLMAMLSYFFLCSRDSLALRLELLVPLPARRTAVRMAAAVAREIRLYLQGQLLVALAVGALTAVALVLIGVRSAVVLGGIVGLLNMVPYFGPFIGGVPAVIIALGDGWQRALWCLGALVLVQQLDSAIISPRVMGSLTGFSPAAVLVAIYAGATLGGIPGMLLTLPAAMSIRTVFRVFVQQRENN